MRNLRSFLLPLVCLSLIWWRPATARGQATPTDVLHFNQPVERTVNGAFSHSYRFSLPAGVFARVTLQPEGINLLYTLSTAQGVRILWENTVEGVEERLTAKNIVVAVTEDTELRLTVEPMSRQAQSGKYTLTFVEQRAAEPKELAATRAARLYWQAQALFDQKTTESLTQAVAVWREALQSAEQGADRWRMAWTLMSLGSAYELLYEWERALTFYDQSLALWRAQANTGHELTVIGRMMPLLRRTGQYQRALTNNFRARELLRQTGRRREEATALSNGGALYQKLGDHAQARAHYLEALQIRSGFNETRGMASILNNLGALANAEGKLSEASEYFERARQLAEENKNPSGVSSALLNQGTILYSQGRYEEAEQKLLAALRLRRSIRDGTSEALMLLWLGRLYLKTNRRAEAETCLNEGLALSRRAGERANERDALHELAALAEQNGDLTTALRLLEQALQLSESIQSQFVSDDARANFTSSRQGLYRFYLACLLRRYEQDKQPAAAALAFQAVERARARSLQSLLAEAGAQLQSDVDPSLRTQERTLRDRIEKLVAEQQALRNRQAPAAQQTKAANDLSLLLAEYEQLQARIKQSHPRYASLTQPEPLTLQDIQARVLDNDTLLLEYALGEERSYLFAVTPETLQVFKLAPRAEIETAARRLHELLGQRGQAPVFSNLAEKQRWLAQLDRETAATAQIVGRLLIQPAAAALPGKRLLIVPDGVLHYVPFAVLPEALAADAKRTGKRRASDNGQPLIVGHEIVTLPSVSTLALLRRGEAERTATPKMLALFADPVFGKDDERVLTTASGSPRPVVGENDAPRNLALLRLPFSRQEAQAIAALVPESQRKLALDFAAARAVVLSDDLTPYRYLHFATHGLLDNEHPELSALALSLVDQQGTAQDGYLRTLDVFKLKLNAELVVLSGCRTALGKEINNEGLIGLTRGFMYAGARRVVASLWQVNDAATAELMKRFYQGMLGEQKLSSAAALRAAQIAMWRDKRWQAPYYWAAFTLQGEW